ncbi:LysR family transcriptional regulator [Paenibacillus glycanilyticus]|uniref:Transcriptional regulator n=1 Tax=Paenibacillus glycanilyticus TaxID=126569 RepID=A0ABQ6GDU7_9BACL|nr:LysR family transcriptional regulator [Paenibacillus glycanilyticus]GLX67466.1 transcriptional regulator [Paenibacillus glycanilyticus]
MNLEQLHHIVETARRKSLARAAESLHISQSGLSQSITAFEKYLGFPIFKRSRIGAEVMPSGKRIIQLATHVLELLDEMKQEAQDQVQLLNNKISLAGIPGVMGSFMKIAGYLKSKHEGISIEISEKGSIQSIKEIEEEQLDAAFIAVTESLLVSLASYTFHKVSEGRMIIGAGKNSPIAARSSSITPEELLKHPFVLYEDDFVHWFIDDFQQKYGKVNVLFSSNNVEAVSKAVIEWNAVTIGHDYTFFEHPLVTRKEIVPLELEGYQQSLVSFGWLIGAHKKTHLLEECMALFEDVRRLEDYDPNHV